jgi:hypothetical protein
MFVRGIGRDVAALVNVSSHVQFDSRQRESVYQTRGVLTV